ncbi:MAG: PHP domain-containing protein [Gemmatimonadota bacterium]|nr:PHP domain-containing protein [Gemmatimonadota bacterium]
MAAKPNYPCDLHVHTTASDGGYQVEELVSRAGKMGMQAIAITDHDTIASIERGVSCSAGLELRVVPGVELSTRERYHVLGYFIDPGAQDLAVYLEWLKERSWEFMSGLLDRLRAELGLKVTDEELAGRTGAGIPNMVHLLDVMVRRGDFAGDAEFDSHEVTEFFGDRNFMVNFFRRFALSEPFVDAEGAIELILSAGGVPVWAHPMLAEKSEIIRLKGAGLMGLEVNTPKHDLLTRNYLLRICESLNLIPTGGTDYHGRYFSSIEHGRQIGHCGVDSDLLVRLAGYANAAASG